jgi:hypothetical protein
MTGLSRMAHAARRGARLGVRFQGLPLAFPLLGSEAMSTLSSLHRLACRSSVVVLLLASACGGLAAGEADAGTSSAASGSSGGSSSGASSGGSSGGRPVIGSPPPPGGSTSGGSISPPGQLPESGPPVAVGPDPGDCGCGDELQPQFDAPPPQSMEPVVPFAAQTPVKVAGVCTPYSQVPAMPFVPVARNPQQSVGQILSGTSAAMSGSWIGSVTSPWGNWYVTLTFEADGHYLEMGYDRSQPLPSANPPGFYYGTNNDTDPSCIQERQWRLDAIVGSDLTVSGQIDVPFWYYPGCRLPGWQGVLTGIAFDATSDRMEFSFSRSDGYGPVVYDLWRVCYPAVELDGGFDE